MLSEESRFQRLKRLCVFFLGRCPRLKVMPRRMALIGYDYFHRGWKNSPRETNEKPQLTSRSIGRARQSSEISPPFFVCLVCFVGDLLPSAFWVGSLGPSSGKSVSASATSRTG